MWGKQRNERRVRMQISEGVKVTGALDAIEGMDRDGGRLFVMNAFGIAGNASMGVYK